MKKMSERGKFRASLIILVLLISTGLVLSGIYFVSPGVYEKAYAKMHSNGGLHFAKDFSKSKKTEEVAEEAPVIDYTFEPHAVENTQPEKWIQSTDIQVEGRILEPGEKYVANEEIQFGVGRDYTEVNGILTFRGNNFRDAGSYGTADMVEEKFEEMWTKTTSALKAPDGYVWTGNGWTGQPLIIKWSQETRQHMNMYSWAQEAEDLTEVIYASLDGYIYFLDINTGEETRPAMHVGYTFKGAGALDPRGYPIMYVGSGYDSTAGKSHAFVINLLTCEIMYEFGQHESFSKRGNLSYFDSSALVDAETDQLIYPGESGVLYIIKLNSQYDVNSGTLSVNPSEPVKWRYTGKRNWYLGMEDSALAYKGYLFFTTNDGYMFCLNLNTLETVWVQDTLDDTNCTSVMELENGHPYIYTSTSFHLGWRDNNSAQIPIWKIDAETGEYIWHTSYECKSIEGNSGGVQGTLALGMDCLADLIFVPVAKTPTVNSGKIVALSKATGEEVWCLDDKAYSWSSPVTVYSNALKGYIITCDSIGDMYMLDGRTGEVLDKINLGSNVEATPIVYNGTIVVGTRGQKIYGIRMK